MVPLWSRPIALPESYGKQRKGLAQVDGDGVIDVQRELAKPSVTHTDVADKFQDLCVRGTVTVADR